MSKDFLVTIKVRNARLLRKIREAGFQSCSAFARANGVSVQALSGLLTMRLSPLGRNDWTNVAFAISSALRCEPEDIWPAHIAKLRTNATRIEFDANLDELVQIPAPSERMVEPKDLERLLSRLAPRERVAIAGVFGLDGSDEKTLQEIGKDLGGVSPARAGQIMLKGIRRLQRPTAGSRKEHYV